MLLSFPLLVPLSFLPKIYIQRPFLASHITCFPLSLPSHPDFFFFYFPLLHALFFYFAPSFLSFLVSLPTSYSPIYTLSLLTLPFLPNLLLSSPVYSFPFRTSLLIPSFSFINFRPLSLSSFRSSCYTFLLFFPFLHSFSLLFTPP